MTLLEYLTEARGLIAKGWTRGVMARDADGRQTPYGGPKAVAFCMAGALNHVGDGGHFCEAVQRLANVIGWPIAPWNDQPERTQEQVLAAFDRAIWRLTSERGSASVDNTVT